MPFGLREGLSRPCVVVEALTEYPTMLGFDASPEREIPLARYQKQFQMRSDQRSTSTERSSNQVRASALVQSPT